MICRYIYHNRNAIYCTIHYEDYTLFILYISQKIETTIMLLNCWLLYYTTLLKLYS